MYILTRHNSYIWVAVCAICRTVTQQYIPMGCLCLIAVATHQCRHIFTIISHVPLQHPRSAHLVGLLISRVMSRLHIFSCQKCQKTKFWIISSCVRQCERRLFLMETINAPRLFHTDSRNTVWSAGGSFTPSVTSSLFVPVFGGICAQMHRGIRPCGIDNE